MTAATNDDEYTQWDKRMALSRLVPCFQEDFRVTCDTRDAVAADDVAAWMSDVLGRKVVAVVRDDFVFDTFVDYLRHHNVFLTLVDGGDPSSPPLRFVGLRRVMPRKRFCGWIADALTRACSAPQRIPALPQDPR